MKSKKILFLITGIAIVVVGAGYYWYSHQETQLETVKIGIFAAGPEGLTFRVIKDKGLDKANGLNIEVISASSPGDIERQLRDGLVNVGVYSPISVAKTDASGGDLRIIALLFKNIASVVVSANSPYKTIADLKGKKIASLPAVTTSYTESDLVLKQVYGLSLEKDFQVTFVSDFGTMAQLLKDHVVDAIIATPAANTPILPLVASGNAVVLASLETSWEQATNHTMPFSVITAHDAWLQSHPQVADKLRKTINDAQTLIATDPSIMKQYASFLGVTDQKTAAILAGFPKLFYFGSSSTNTADFNYLMAQAKAQGFISAIPPNIVYGN